jgi:hypothetical protein
MRWTVAVFLCGLFMTALGATDSVKVAPRKHRIRKDTTKVQRPKPITQGEIDRWE